MNKIERRIIMNKAIQKIEMHLRNATKRHDLIDRKIDEEADKMSDTILLINLHAINYYFGIINGLSCALQEIKNNNSQD